ncbi:isochorismatase family cysteine hydrolase [Pseudoteredinibacter isoporae]|uniref:Ureidoacrylate peracid hydrolase n=1 Tax=Pseudoteredinibacter isoporae TaxID=570281 RepID=A0A7X0JTF9_9GAMM|nr:isochorismatase family cysteine hydrolase [Pseudoteredinibacter isoporae]MBB6521125.1 ureidoacrylate peracid hydrolase [Pseudoteredinibacter isoporae]NHO86686.1 cysteine hydrolase [Pseudoteredinibacter isoporae]NIB24862.1 cysteine hydrolase [Pseudoteredinibacter isoporae]
MARRSDALHGGNKTLTRNRPIGAIENSALLVVDMQYYVAAIGCGEHADMNKDNVPEDKQYFFDRIENTVVPNIQALQKCCRTNALEVMFTNVESLTKDGRDRGLDYKISGFHIPPGSQDGKTLAPIAPVDDEIVIRKTSSSVFNSTNIDYVLRAMEKDYLIVVGLLTDQCVESTVRDACDLGYLVTVVEDACVTYSQDRHERALDAYSGYCRRISTAQLIAEINGVSAGH